MKRILILTITVITVVALVVGISTAMAAKPQNVIEKSNGYPSGKHFNLNIQGKNADYVCDPSAGGNVVKVLLDDDAGAIEQNIQYVSNKKANVYELRVLDNCAEPFDGSPAKVQIPYNIQLDDGSVIPAEGYYVFGRIRGKPNNGDDCGEDVCPSKFILSPNLVVQACNDAGDPDFPDYTDCLLALGLITQQDIYVATDEAFLRFEPPEPDQKGKSAKARYISDLFRWSGWVYDSVLDTSGPGGVPDGVVDEWDVPLTYDGADGSIPDGVISEAEFNIWRADQEAAGLATHHTDVWIFDIADLVVTQQPIDNDGTKLMKLRFYPVATTEFTPPQPE
ncbi:MAG: hypothetical protein JSV02_09590 [Dehalococcoidia bacterium]|nr:MAG: hypothetical protein JSV02_09590 [Dehalococcoidia bacterium]